MPQAFHLELSPIREAAALFGDPQSAFRTVHISGTNGKGSTAAFLQSILMESGYRVGLYTSPHLLSLVERIRINDVFISEKTFAELASEVRSHLSDERALSYFEYLTLVAFLYFQRSRVDIAVMETGLGGRLDATNIITPEVHVITSISFDHMRHLGPSLTCIAEEKCGIIKRGASTVTAQQPLEVMDVIRRFCDDVGSALCVADPGEITTSLGLAGEHQRQNAACAVEAARLLSHAGFSIGSIEKALAKTRWAARLQVVHEKPRVIIDAAHNAAGSEVLASYLEKECGRNDTTLLLGAFADKDIRGIIRPLVPCVGKVVCVEAPSPRAASPKDLAASARSFGATVVVDDVPRDALERLMKTMKEHETLVVAGSVTVAAEAMRYFGKGKK